MNYVQRAGSVGVDLPEEQSSDFAIKNLSRWAIGDDNYWGVTQSTENLPSGLFRCAMSSSIGPYFIKMQNDSDSLLHLPDSQSEKVIDEIKEFSSLKSEFKNRGFMYKRGILLWGPPGSGKTSTVRLLLEHVITKMNGIAVYIDHPYHAAECFHLLRKIEPKRQVIAIMEDLDELVRNHGESEYLSLLDGESQIENVVFVATTNYPENLDKRFKNRPSRFDSVHYIGMPSEEARELFLKTKEPELSDIELKKMVKVSKGYSIAHLKELLVLTRVFGRSINDAAERMSDMIESNISSENSPEKKEFGFTAS